MMQYVTCNANCARRLHISAGTCDAFELKAADGRKSSRDFHAGQMYVCIEGKNLLVVGYCMIIEASEGGFLQ